MATEETKWHAYREILYVAEQGAIKHRTSSVVQVSYKAGYRMVETNSWALIIISRGIVCELDKKWWMVMREMSKNIIVIDTPMFWTLLAEDEKAKDGN